MRVQYNEIRLYMNEVTRTHPYTVIVLLCDFDQMPDAQLRSFPLCQIVTGATSARQDIHERVFLVSNTHNPTSDQQA